MVDYRVWCSGTWYCAVGVCGVYVDVGRGRRRPQSNWHIASFTVKTVRWALSETANMQLQQRDELRYICTRFSSAISAAESSESFTTWHLMSRVRLAAILICLCNCIAADIYRGRHRRNSSVGVWDSQWYRYRLPVVVHPRPPTHPRADFGRGRRRPHSNWHVASLDLCPASGSASAGSGPRPQASQERTFRTKRTGWRHAPLFHPLWLDNSASQT